MTDTLTRTGTEILLVYGAKLFPARADRAGMRCTVDGQGVVLVEAVGYGCATARAAALALAAETCLDAGLEVHAMPSLSPACILVRRKKSSC